MMNSDIFTKFCRERNIRESTVNGYRTALDDYAKFNDLDLSGLIDEAFCDENNGVVLKERKIKQRLVDYRSYLLDSGRSPNTSKTYFSKIKTFYKHFEIELPYLPAAKYDKIYESNFDDLPSKENIRQAVELADNEVGAIILFMSSSGSAKAETLSMTVNDFVTGCRQYHRGGSLKEILDALYGRNDIVPTLYLKRAKTDKYYYTFCSPEASKAIVNYLRSRENLRLEDKLFDISSPKLLTRFQKINDEMGWGFIGRYRFFRTHALRKFHASNIGLGVEYIDSLQGRSKNEVHAAYIKTNPKKLKEMYKSVMKNVMIYADDYEKNINQEFTIVVNIFLAGKEYNII